LGILKNKKFFAQKACSSLNSKKGGIGWKKEA
jgi:hypothetical protein